MGTIIDYLKWRGDITFKEKPLNEIDNLILSEIVYFEFSDVMTKDETITLEDAYTRYQRLTESYHYATNDPLPLLAEAVKTDRFKDVIVRNFVDIIDNDRGIQFAAASFILPDHSIYIAFRGTDNSIVGWREDFNQSFLDVSPAQEEAVKYLKKALKQTKRNVTVGGHSKGGNLAVYASAFSGMTQRIDIIYSNDGPGFNEHISSTEEYNHILPKVCLIMPESSIVGILYNNKEDKIIVQSSENLGHKQHSPYTWLLEGAHFLLTDKQSSTSLYFDEAFNQWLGSLDSEERENFVNTIFDTLDAVGVNTLAEVGENKLSSYNIILKAIKEISAESKDQFKESLKKLAQIGRKSLLNDSRK